MFSENSAGYRLQLALSVMLNKDVAGELPSAFDPKWDRPENSRLGVHGCEPRADWIHGVDRLDSQLSQAP